MRTALAVSLAFLGASSPLGAQVAPTRYDSLFDQLLAMPKPGDSAFPVSGKTIRRDAASFILHNGNFFPLSPVDGRVVGGVFIGTGTFTLVPPTKVEREQLRRERQVDSLRHDFRTLFLLFADSSDGEIAGGGTLAPLRGTSVAGVARQGLEFLSHKVHRFFDPNVMSAFMNRERNELFFAVVSGTGGPAFAFQVDPYEPEEISLAIPRAGPSHTDNRLALITRFHRTADYAAGPFPPNDAKDPYGINRYVVDATIAKNLDFKAKTAMSFDWWGPQQDWIPLWLFEELAVDSARWAGGQVATVARAKDNPVLWVRRPDVAANAGWPNLELHYHGDLLRGNGPWVDLKTSAGWYPTARQITYGSLATAVFDFTFHTPKALQFASVGVRTDSSMAGDVMTTRWVTSRPFAHASFNLGQFEVHRVKDPRANVDVYINQEAHDKLPLTLGGGRGIAVGIPQQANMKESVGEDVVLSVNFFRDAFGDPLVDRFYATEISGGHGQAFPGLIHFSWLTYQGFLLAKGEDESFRSHEVAHQWWGLGVDPKSYRDAWISEGFAEFSGWWYTEVILRDSVALDRMLQRSAEVLMSRRRQAGPLWLGTRLAEGAVPRDYAIVVYQKGAWVLRMLRYLMLDPDRTGEEGFRGMMRDFYDTYRGGQASTEDFQGIVEKHMRSKMDWFFNSWVYGTGIPTYEWAHQSVPEGNEVTWKLRVRRSEVPPGFTMHVPVRLFFADGREAFLRVVVKDEVTDFSVKVPARPSRVEFNAYDGVLAEVKEGRWR